MKKLHLLAAASVLAAAPAFAQSLGTVTSVNGVATVTSGGSASTLSQGMALSQGARIVTTSTSSAVVRLNNGCTLSVPPGHSVTLLSNLTCQQLHASLQPVTPVATVPTTAVMGQARNTVMGFDPVVGIWVAALAAAVIYDATHDANEVPVSAR